MTDEEEAVERWSDRWMERFEMGNGEMNERLQEVVDPDY